MVEGFAADRDPDRRSVRGIPTRNRHLWAVLGGAALGAGIGVLAPGGTKSAWKGVIIGGSGADHVDGGSGHNLITPPGAAAR